MEPWNVADNPAENKENGPASRKRILVVDDSASIRTILVQVLKLQGYDVLTATNSLEALQICIQDPGLIDVLVTDLQMPELSGEELIRRAKAGRPELRAICMTAAISATSLDESVLLVPKPFTLREMISTVRSALEGGQTRCSRTG
jgi:two-component system cell cycle sensor histidine kinase/response regulator CckA